MSETYEERRAAYEAGLPPEWIAGACTRCGKCCLKVDYMESLYATPADVARWKSEGRLDILQYAWVMVSGADLWFSENGEQLPRCPFLRKDRGRNTYKCLIHETRPEVCRGYPYGYDQMVADDCEIPAAVVTVVQKMDFAKSNGKAGK